MKSHAVIGANYGDEGKGLITAALCAPYGSECLNVRFNGSAQAGHTVEHGGKRHVFHHLGSGASTGAYTYLARHFYGHPMLFVKDLKAFRNTFEFTPTVWSDPRSNLITPYDVMLNQWAEQKRGSNRHGSCGVGFGEAVERSTKSPFSLTFGNVEVGDIDVQSRLNEIRKVYVPIRAEKLGFKLSQGQITLLDNDEIIAKYINDLNSYSHVVDGVEFEDLSCGDFEAVIFEGAQGLGLDQHNSHFPHVTRSNTGLKNVLEFANETDLEYIEPVYVTRSYLTRHGTGPLENEDAEMSFRDDTNENNEYQGPLRFAPLDMTDTGIRIMEDLRSNNSWRIAESKLAVTCCDQLETDINAEIRSYGPSIADVRFIEKEQSDDD